MPDEPLQVHRYGGTTVEIFADFVRTTLPDGSPVYAVPGETDEDMARAAALGYGEGPQAVLAMTWDHDRFHALLAHAWGLPESPALRQTVEESRSELAGAEEAAVLAIQRWWNLCRRQP